MFSGLHSFWILPYGSTLLVILPQDMQCHHTKMLCSLRAWKFRAEWVVELTRMACLCRASPCCSGPSEMKPEGW